MTFSYGVTSYQRPYIRKLVFELQNKLEALKCARVPLYQQPLLSLPTNTNATTEKK